MNDDDLKKLWQRQPVRTPDVAPEQVMSAMRQKASQLRITLFWRDVRELSACVIVGVIFGIYYFTNRAPVSRLGALLTVLGSVFIAWRILHARRKTPPAKPDATLVESLRAELHSVRVQSQMLRTIAWWYLLPLTVGTFVFTWGMTFDGMMVFYFGFNIVFTLFTLALDVWIYRLNQRAVTEQLLPVERQLKAALRSAETGEPMDEAHAAKLRPIALSIASGEKIKPVGFDVAFWQIAIFGLPGIVGIWFFWIPSASFDPNAVKTSAPPPALVQAVFTGETNRYSIVAMKVVDRFNAGDFAAVQSLYDANMKKIFPPEKTAAFYGWLATEFGRVKQLNGPTGKGYFGQSEFQLHFQHGDLPMSLALDANDEISGIYFKTPSANATKFKLAVRRYFSWRHLVWLPLFVLGGLLYSWLMQKTVKRAVGISALGIHLRKGQTLILWDEIAEVRPFKFLYIRNLRLIKDTGETTIMHWTPLERHRDVRAAVEKYAPADHPIRKYLSLLK